MDYGALPPEINSSRMYTGPGSGPMMAAAAAWGRLAADLRSAASSYHAVISGLTGQGWHGPASASMAAAAAPFVAWLATTSAQAEQTATDARAAADAFDAAFAMTVPPQVIAANRLQLQSLVATNLLGQNTPAIAANEAHYGEMWAQDAAAMYGYAGNSAAAARLTPFSPPPPTTNPAGLAGQTAAVAHAAGASAGGHAQLMSTMPQALQALASPAASAADPPSPLMTLQMLETAVSIIASGASVAVVSTAIPIVLTNIGLVSTNIGLTSRSIEQKEQEQQQKQSQPPVAAESAGRLVSGSSANTAAPVSAHVGRATTIGALAVPPSWSVGTVPAKIVAAALQHAGLGAAPATSAAATGDGGLLTGMPIAGMAGAGLGGAAGGSLGARGRIEKPAGPSDYRTAIAAALGRPGTQTSDSVGRADVAEIGNGEEQLSESVTLTKLEREILAVVRRYTAGQ